VVELQAVRVNWSTVDVTVNTPACHSLAFWVVFHIISRARTEKPDRTFEQVLVRPTVRALACNVLGVHDSILDCTSHHFAN